MDNCLACQTGTPGEPHSCGKKMTDNIQELRDWSARKVGFTLRCIVTDKPYQWIYPDGTTTIGYYAWRPDDELAPGGQILMFITKMEESGWRMSADNLTTPGKYDVEFIHKDYNPKDEYPEGAVSARSSNLFLAILLAGWKTENPDEF